MSLNPRITLGALDLTDYPYAVEFGAVYGAPETVYEMLSSLLADGELVGSSRVSNRQIVIPIIIEGPDMLALADAAATLVAECDKQRNTLTFDPGDGFGPPTVFETFRAQLTHERTDESEIAGIRRYTLTIPALPYARSVDKVTDAAVAASWSAGTVYDDGTATTNWSGWTAYRTPAVAVDSGMVRVDYGAKTLRSAYADGEGITQWENRDTRSGLSIPTGTGGYLSIVVKLEKTFSRSILLNFGGYAQSRIESITLTTSTGATLTPTFSAVEQLADGQVRIAMALDAGLTITSITVQSFQYAYTYTSPSDARVWYGSLIFSSTTTTANQYAKVVEVAGSVRAPGSIHVSSATALGRVFLCTVADDQIAPGFTADITKWKTSGGSRTTDAAVVNGGFFPANTGSYVFEIPATMLTEGAYTVVMLVKNGNPNSATVTAQTVIGSTAVGSVQTITNTEPTDSGGGTAYRFLTVGELYLPTTPVQLPDSTCKVRITVQGIGPAFAEVWLAPTWGDLTLADCGTGTVSATGASSNFWVDSPSPDRPMGAWWRGASTDRARALSATANLMQPGRHLLHPPRTRVFVASSAAQGPLVSVEYYPRHWDWATQ